MANKPIKSLQLTHDGPIYDLAPLWENIQGVPEIKDTTYSAGTGLKLDGTTFNHKNSIVAGTAQGSSDKTLSYGDTFTIPTVTYDAQGHVTNKGVTTITMPDNIESKNVVGSSTATNDTTSILENGNVYLNHVEEDKIISSHKISGTGSTTVKTDASGNIVINSTKYEAGSGLTLTGNVLNHSNSVTAGTAKGDDNKKLAFSGTFTIPTVTYDAQGHIKSVGTTTMTMPDNPNTDTTYSAGGGIAISSTNQISNTGVRSISTGSVEGTISVNTNGKTTNVAVHGLGSAAYKEADNFAEKIHTHLYAGSETAGGSATKAERLTTDAGSTTQPIYFLNGVPVATTYFLKKSVPADAKFTDTTYENATTTTSGLMSKEDKIKLNATNVAYGTCSTAASTTEKIVTIVDNENWQLAKGSLITVKFTNTNTAENAKLNVNGTGAYPIWYNNAAFTTGGSYAGYKNRHITYQFDGSYWVFVSWSYDGNSDTKVAQNAVNTNNINYPIILGFDASTTKVTDAVNKSADLIYNPSTKILTVPTVKGNLDGNAASADTALTADSASVANKIGTETVGSATKPVYIKDGVPTAISYTIGKSVPSDAIFKYTAGTGIDITNSTISNKGVLSIEAGTGSTNGTIGLIINEDSANPVIASVKGLGSAAYTNASDYETPAGASAKMKEAKDYTDTKIDLLMNNPDGAINSILELAQAIEDHKDVTDALNAAIGNKAKANHKHTITHTPTGTIGNASITPKGKVTSSFTGTQFTHDHTFTGTAQEHKHTFTGSKGNISIKYTPQGTVSTNFSGSTIETSGSSGKTEVPTAGHVHKYTPEGSVSQPTFTGTSVTSGAASATQTVKSVTNVGSAPSLTASVTNRCLKLTFGAGSVPTVESIIVADGIHTHTVTASGTVSKPTFTGTEGSVVATTTKTDVASNGHIHSATIEGTSTSTFIGNEATLTAEFTPAGSIGYTSVTPGGTISNVAITPEGSVTSTFTGTAAEHTHTFTGNEATLTSGTEI